MLAKHYVMKTGVGASESALVSFDKALLNSGVGNYNLVRLSSILPAKCQKVGKVDLTEGSLLPTAYSTISSNNLGDILVSVIGVGFPVNKDKVGVIMEYSAIGKTANEAVDILKNMIVEAFETRNWALDRIELDYASAVVDKKNETKTTFACIAEW